jgi:hypothetical protein
MELKRTTYRLGDVIFDFSRRELINGAKVREITPQESKFLEYLIKQYPDCPDRKRLCSKLWPNDAASIETKEARLRSLCADLYEHLDRIGISRRDFIKATGGTIKLVEEPIPQDPASRRDASGVTGIVARPESATDLTRQRGRTLHKVSKGSSEGADGSTNNLQALPTVDPGFTFFPVRNDSGPFDLWLKDFTEVWISFCVGTILNNPDVYRYRNIRRILVMDPKSPYFEQVVAHFNTTFERAEGLIYDITETAQGYGVEVKWIDYVINNMIIGNPEGSGGVVKWEILMPYVTGIDRPSVSIDALTYQQVFDRARHCFEMMWKEGYPPRGRTARRAKETRTRAERYQRIKKLYDIYERRGR